MIARHTTAEEMAQTVGIDPSAFRAALRNVKHTRKRNTDWQVTIGSQSYSQMRTILASLRQRKAA